MYCKKCGAQINDDAVFCEKCGAKQGSSTSTQHTSSPAQSEPQEKKMTPEEIIKDFDGNLYDAIKYLALRDGISMGEAGRIIRSANAKISNEKQHPQNHNDVDEPYIAMEKAFRNKIKKAIIIGVSVVFGFLLLKLVFSNLVCIHSWMDATCTAPITCSKCGKEKGEALGHVWVDATCISAKHCERCNKKIGNPLGHDVDYKTVKKASCSESGKKEGVCKRCNQKLTENIPTLDHTPSGKWVVTQKATYDDPVTIRVQYCTVCGEIAKEEEVPLTDAEKISALKSLCKSYSFKEISRNPDSYSGKYAYFKGEITQVVQEASFTKDAAYRICITHNGYFWTDAIMVVFEGEMSDGSRLIEDDVVKMYGKLDGTYTYETVLGASMTIPMFRAQYIERVN